MIFLACASYHLNIVIASVLRLAGQPAYLINYGFIDFQIVLGICTMTIAVTVLDLFGKDVPPRDKINMGTAWLIISAVAFYLVVEQPNVRPLAERLRPDLDIGYEYDLQD